MYEDYLRDTCDIYHLADAEVSVGYGIEASDVMRWQDKPALSGIPCHFHVQSNFLEIIQSEPETDLQGRVKLSLPAGTDIRMNDLIVSVESESIHTGIRFRADAPRTIHGGHHIIVILRREEGRKGAV